MLKISRKPYFTWDKSEHGWRAFYCDQCSGLCSLREVDVFGPLSDRRRLCDRHRD